MRDLLIRRFEEALGFVKDNEEAKSTLNAMLLGTKNADATVADFGKHYLGLICFMNGFLCASNHESIKLRSWLLFIMLESFKIDKL